MGRTIKPQELSLAGKHLIDVRRKEDRDASSEQLPGATWHDPNDIAHWTQSLPRDKEIVLYCVRGGLVSNSVVDTLQSQGLNARFIEGGIEGWKAAGGKVTPKI
ncbi:MAG: rhodanese-like domain-containing protein [Zoogloea oleivorans]|jgi:rhodanese-related sulfurtransferase|uniref:rhodanese-like domain-containing protein n=1 Tax=Zoogloea oleivorans TaxID=1552750 RepID=UPI002A35B0ED|nr:rhodanese-like domain-containing protein [Zoogloea oleivorans]MDY0038461.1 rhodanese-like domain-containing protein [Zoogloea oleivorans]